MTVKCTSALTVQSAIHVWHLIKIRAYTFYNATCNDCMSVSKNARPLRSLKSVFRHIVFYCSAASTRTRPSTKERHFLRERPSVRLSVCLSVCHACDPRLKYRNMVCTTLRIMSLVSWGRIHEFRSSTRRTVLKRGAPCQRHEFD